MLIIGPIASGKTTLANTLADKLRGSGRAVAVVGLDTVAEMALPTLADWTWAHEVHGRLVGAWLETPIPIVVAEGPETPTEIEQVLLHVGSEVRVLRILITSGYVTALARAMADPNRGLSKDPDFLRGMYDRFEATRDDIAYDLKVDTEDVSSSDIARQIMELLLMRHSSRHHADISRSPAPPS